MEKKCLSCESSLLKRHQLKFCSNKCQMDFQYIKYIESWTSGWVDGNVGISAKNISRHLKKYIISKCGNKCSECGWSKRHPITNTVPLEIDHIDGNADNNSEINLRLLCPNCHALTPYFKNFNKGKGRTWRRNKYIKNKN